MIEDPISGIIAKAKGAETKTYFLTVVHDLSMGESVIADCTQQIISREDFDWLVNTASKFYTNHNDHEIAGMNLEIRETLFKSSYNPTEKTKETKKDEGFVYLLKADNGLFKIGRTKAIDDRIKQLEISSPYELELILNIKSDSYRELEEILHLQFDDKRAKGEWFELSEADIEYIKALEA